MGRTQFLFKLEFFFIMESGNYDNLFMKLTFKIQTGDRQVC